MALNPFQIEVQAQLAGLSVKLEDILKVSALLEPAIKVKLPVIHSEIQEVLLQCDILHSDVKRLAALVQEIGSAE